MNVPPLPPLLKKSEWQKHASIVAKVMPGKSSGISDALAKLETAYTAFSAAANQKTPQQAVAKADQHSPSKLGQLADAVQVAAGSVKAQANTSATAWKAKLCPVPKTTREYAEKIEGAATSLLSAILKLRADI